AWSPNGKMVATVIQLPGQGLYPYTQGVKVWDAHTGKPLWTLLAPQGGLYSSPVAFSPDSKTVAALVHGHLKDFKQEIRVWRTARGKERGTFDVSDGQEDPCWNLVFSPDGKTLAAVGPVLKDGKVLGGYVRLFDARTGKVLWQQTKAHTDRVYGIAFSPT